MNKTLSRIATIFLVIGLALLLGGCYAVARGVAFLGRAKAAPGIVIEVQSVTWSYRRGISSVRYTPIIRFMPETGAPQVVGGSGSWLNEYAVGDPVEVHYDPANPAHAVIDTFHEVWADPAIVIAFGLFASLVGGGVHAFFRVKARRAAKLRRTGTRVQAAFQSVEKNLALRVNGRNPWMIVCQWIDPATQQVHVFESDNIWFDPTPHVHGKEITVFIDRADPSRYWVDSSFLPKLAQ